MTQATVPTESRWRVYTDDHGVPHHQPWQGLVESGTLIDPDSGADMTMVGRTTDQAPMTTALPQAYARR